MAPQPQLMKSCNLTHATSPWTEAYHAATSQPTPSAQRTTPEQKGQDETQVPTHDALSAIYNRGY